MSVQVVTPEVVTEIGLSPEEWADRIRQRHGDAVEAVVDVGRILIQAKAELGHGQFSMMIRCDLPFGHRTAQMFMKIARHPVLSNPSHGSCLPSSWRTLHAISGLPAKQVEELIRFRRIRPETQRSDMEEVVQKHRESVRADEYRAKTTRERLTGHIDVLIRKVENVQVHLYLDDSDVPTCKWILEKLAAMKSELDEGSAVEISRVPS